MGLNTLVHEQLRTFQGKEEQLISQMEADRQYIGYVSPLDVAHKGLLNVLTQVLQTVETVIN